MGNLKRRVIAIFIAVSFLLTSISVIAITPAGQESTHGTGSGIPEASMSPVSVTPSGVLYNVTFTVSGLPLNEVWFATLNGSQKDNVVNHSPFYADNISFSIAPGLYNYSITTYTNFLTTYTPSPETGTVNVIDRNISVNITYKPSPMIP